jgi:hypothetical protein
VLKSRSDLFVSFTHDSTVYSVTYQSQTNFHCSGDQNWPSNPCSVIAGNHTLPHVYGSHGACNVDDDTQPEDRNDGETLAGGELQTPDERHWDCSGKEVGEDIDHTGREDNVWVIHALVVELGFDFPVSLDGSAHNISVWFDVLS